MADDLPPVVPAPSITLTGEPRVGSALTVEPGDWTPSNVSLAYAWYVDDVPVESETTERLVLGPDLLGHSVMARVTGSAEGYTSAALQTGSVAIAPGAMVSTPVPTIEGQPRVGAALTAVPGSWDDGVTLAYQWFVGGEKVPDATSSMFTPSPAHLDQPVWVEVTGSRTAYTSVAVASAPTSSVAAGQFVPGAVTVSGSGRVGEPLVVQPGSWTPEPAFSYQWSVDGTPIADATGTAFTPELADQGKPVTVTVTGTLGGYSPHDVTSAPVVVGAPVFRATPTPTIAGTARVGTTLTANPGAWSPIPSFAYQWLADGVAVAGATQPQFTPQAAQRTKRISVRVTGSITGYPTTIRTSAQTAPVAYGVFTSAPIPVIIGTPKVGVTLKVAPGTWSPAATLSYQWRANGVAVTGATGSSFAPAAAHRGARITVTVTARRDGFTTASRTSAASAVVAWGTFAVAPTPRVSGYPQIGWTLTAVPGTWSPWGALTYQWKANGVSIAGATGSAYKPVSADFGKRLTVTVTAKRPGYVNGVRVSVTTIPVTKPFTRIATPTIVGTTRVFSSLTARPGSWYPAPTFAYQWKRNGAAISGATRSTYRLAEADYGKRITVTVTARRTGYTPVARTSASSATVLGPAASLKGDGSYRVGVSLGAGTYVAPGGNGCYWERRRYAGSDLDGVIANDLSFGGRRIVTISSSDAYFVTEDCGSWTRLAKLGTPASSFGDGAQMVGVHIRPGLYYAPGGDGCYWEGLSGFGGSLSDVIENDYSDFEPQYVQIYSWVVGFDSDSCGGWTRIGD